MWANNKTEAKQILRKRELVNGDRGIGKTDALMDVIHEDHKGIAVVVFPTHELRDIFKQRYHEKYPNDPIPKVEPVRIAGMGDRRPVYADVLSLFTEEDRNKLDMVITAAIW